MISRGRETALEVFKSIRLLVDADFSDLRTNGSLPTFSRGHGKKTSSKIETLAEYGTDFFTPTCAPCRAHLRQLCELIGVGKNKEGKFVSTPFPPLFYENFDDTAIVGIFGSEPLYRVRSIVYDLDQMLSEWFNSLGAPSSMVPQAFHDLMVLRLTSVILFQRWRVLASLLGSLQQFRSLYVKRYICSHPALLTVSLNRPASSSRPMVLSLAMAKVPTPRSTGRKILTSTSSIS